MRGETQRASASPSKEALSIDSIRIHFGFGFIERPKAFYERLDLRGWLDTLDWLFAESSDRLCELEGRESTSAEIVRELNILQMLEDEIREADRQYCRLAFINDEL